MSDKKNNDTSVFWYDPHTDELVFLTRTRRAHAGGRGGDLMDATKLESWLPVLEHPVHGEDIRGAAGVDVCWYVAAVTGNPEVSFSAATVAALAFGTLSAMADWDSEGNNVEVERVRRVWYVSQSGRYDGEDLSTQANTLSAAVLAAAYRWLKLEVL